MPRMRTAAKAHELILEQDPESEITLHYIRHLIAVGYGKLRRIDL